MSRSWFVTPDRVPVNWVTILSGGRALSDILRVVAYDDSNDPTVVSYVWRPAGATITTNDLAIAQAATEVDTPPRHPTSWTPPRGRYVSEYELEKRLRQFDADEDAEDNLLYYTKGEVDQRLQAGGRDYEGLRLELDAHAANVTQALLQASEATALSRNLQQVVEGILTEIAAARGSYPTLADRLAAGGTGGGGTLPGGGGNTGDLAFYVSEGYLLADSTGTRGLDLVGIDAEGFAYYDSAGAETPVALINLNDAYPYFDGVASVPGTGGGNVPYLSLDELGYVLADSAGSTGLGLIGAGSDDFPYFDTAGASDPVTSVDFTSSPPSTLSRFA